MRHLGKSVDVKNMYVPPICLDIPQTDLFLVRLEQQDEQAIRAFSTGKVFKSNTLGT